MDLRAGKVFLESIGFQTVGLLVNSYCSNRKRIDHHQRVIDTLVSKLFYLIHIMKQKNFKAIEHALVHIDYDELD